MIILTGCSFDKESKARATATEFFHNELKEAIAKTDEFEIFSVEVEKSSELAFTSIRTFKKGQPSFNMLSESFIKAKQEGEVARHIHDRKVVFTRNDKKIYEIRYCSTDGRIENERNRGGYYGVLFLSQAARELIN